MIERYSPRLIVVAGPNGTGKTSITEHLLLHEWVRLFFVGTDDPSINAKRVAMRVMEGGHDVPIGKIISRYTKSLANCSLIAKIADRSYLYDNSIEGEQARLLFRVANGMLIKLYGPINPWAQEIADLLSAASNDPGE